jgi:hypothetical protein
MKRQSCQRKSGTKPTGTNTYPRELERFVSFGFVLSRLPCNKYIYIYIYICIYNPTNPTPTFYLNHFIPVATISESTVTV